MIHRKLGQKKCFRFSTLFVGAKGASLCKISFMIGSLTGMFSATNCIVPLSGVFGGLMGASVFFGGNVLLRMCMGSFVSFGKLLANCVPGYGASLYWATPSWIIRLALPLVCMALFIAHPVGRDAWLYSLYWLIPVALYVVPRKHKFLEALGSTFVAHALGSVIWLYTVPMTATQWVALIPVVAIERLLFAVGMVICHTIFSALFDFQEHVNAISRMKKLYE